VPADVLGGLLPGVAADLAGHDAQLGLRVVLEQLDDVDERRAWHRVAADADDRRVAEAALGQLVADLVGQRARARDDADVALAEERGRDDPDVRLAGRQHAGAVGADEPGVRMSLLEVVVDQNAHAFASSTTFSAASFIVAAVCTLGRAASARMRRPSSSLVPSRRTTNGTVIVSPSWLKASIRPLATSSQRVMPPKMLNSTAFTDSLERMTSTALVIAS